ncbi:M15 family metallopeptidase [Halobacillus faecis]|uniref:D-alanyl-D-alanine carboxypeptidase n=1 Tax=Halobacillus faecis TaxID=360184 RepID=A0A511WPF1_9BACI|nr:M15 family metallopeptidase [Halobacillus faecis]GEN53014.1 D-alanyl-D-alanine carboxypeptidase [Halobacillus faecis]
MKKVWILTLLSLSLTACSLASSGDEQEAKEDAPASSQKEAEQTASDKEDQSSSGEGTEQAPADEKKDSSSAKTEKDKVLADGTVEVGDPESLQVVVNKNRKLPGDYVPEDLTVPNVPFYFQEDHPKKQMREEAARALEELFEAAEGDGIELVAASGYRSYERQKRIYERNVEVYGKEETDTFSAQPGTSEHQTGLAMDVTSAQVAFKLEQSFGETTEGEWLADHAHEYGFIIRYREGAKDITGYMYEPWHLRYVGKEVSSDVHEQAVTLEEFFGLYPSAE